MAFTVSNRFLMITLATFLDFTLLIFNKLNLKLVFLANQPDLVVQVGAFIVNFIESKEKNEEDDEEKDSIPRIEETFGRLVVDSDSSKRIVKIAKHNNPVKDEHEDPAND